MIYEYAFREQAIAVSYAGGEKIRFMAEPHDYPIARRYPFSDLLARTTICREIYDDAFKLPMRLNTFRVHHLDMIPLFTGFTPPAQLAKVTRLKIGCAPMTRLRSVLLASNLELLTGVTHVVAVETRHWRHYVQDSEESFATWSNRYRILLQECFEISIEVEFE
jgi:hypothetical protein